MSRPISVGVIGLGSIAQIQHLPNLTDMSDLFRITAVADISHRLTAQIAERLPGQVFTSTDWRAVCSHPDVEAVLLLTSGAHEQLAEGALRAGKHVFSEKPLCLTAASAQELHAQATNEGLVLQVGYMKLHEGVLPDLHREISNIGDLRLVRQAVCHPADQVMMSGVETLRFDDASPQILEEAVAFEEQRTAEVLGDLSSQWGTLYRNVLAASLIHSVSFVRGVFGKLPPIISADLWPPSPPRPPGEPPCLRVVGMYPDHLQVEMSWLWLPSYPAYRESFEVYGTGGSLRMQFANPYLREGAATLVVNRSDQQIRYEGGSESPFRRELQAFHRAITTGEHPNDGLGAGQDIAWLREMVLTLAGRGKAGRATADRAEP